MAANNRYVRNNPLIYVDPSGHFTEDAIKKYLEENYENPDELLEQWKGDEDWWNMISTAEAGDFLFGGTDFFFQGFSGQFEGSGIDELTGFQATINVHGRSHNITLEDIRAGSFQFREPVDSRGRRVNSTADLQWVGLLRQNDNGSPHFFLKGGYNVTQKYTPPWMQWTLDTAGIGLNTGVGALTGSALPQNGAQILGALGVNAVSYFTMPTISDMADMQATDVQIHIGPTYFNFQSEPYQGGWTLEKYKWQLAR